MFQRISVLQEPIARFGFPRTKQVEPNRRNVAAHRLRQKTGGVSEVSQAVLADPTEAWRTKASGRTNKYPDRARQRAAADLAAALRCDQIVSNE